MVTQRKKTMSRKKPVKKHRTLKKTLAITGAIGLASAAVITAFRVKREQVKNQMIQDIKNNENS